MIDFFDTYIASNSNQRCKISTYVYSQKYGDKTLWDTRYTATKGGRKSLILVGDDDGIIAKDEASLIRAAMFISPDSSGSTSSRSGNSSKNKVVVSGFNEILSFKNRSKLHMDIVSLSSSCNLTSK